MITSFEGLTRRGLRQLPERARFDQPILCRSIIILPTKRLHDSEWGMIELYACDEKNKPWLKLTQSSDDLTFSAPIRMDCIPQIQAPHVWNPNQAKGFCVGADLSSILIEVL